MIEPAFRWPDGFQPHEAALYVRNVRRIEQPAEFVWETLVRARDWPSWYPNASNVALPGAAVDLAAGMHFRWTQTGIPLRSEIREFAPPLRIAWIARSPWIQAYHAWDIQPDGDACIVVTDETQRGVLPRFFGAFLRPRMLAIHELWLTRLEARSGWPEDMRIALPAETTVAQIVDRVLAGGSPHDADAIEAMLRSEYGLSPHDAALARDRIYGGVVRAATRNVANRPDPVDDPFAWTSFERAWHDPSIVARHFPE